MNLLVLGPQGAGKGTQAKRISREHDLLHISTGERFRHEIAAGTEFGRRVEAVLAAGELVPDELTIGLIRERLGEDDARAGFVLDGFPRNIAQAEALDYLLAALDRPLSAVLEFELPDEVSVERLLGRATEESRIDDTPDAIARRLEIYHRETATLSEHYRARGKLVGIHADRSIDEVWADIERALSQAVPA